MRNRRTQRIGPAEADQLVAGDHPGHPGLRKLLDAARSPGTAQELAGEKAAVAAFTAHRRRAADSPRSARSVTAAVPVAVALALVALGGAARAGNLPREAQQHAHRLFSALGVPAPRTGPHQVVTRPSPTPAPSVTALTWCEAWRARRPLSSAESSGLVAAAGGEERVGGFCAELEIKITTSGR
jgi:hypothetical protein